MSVSVHIVGIKPATNEYKKKLAAYRACVEADVPVPSELRTFFDGLSLESVPTDGMEVEVYDAIIGDPGYGSGAIIDLSKLPEGVTRLRVYMS